jgi:hypothetical protein
MRSVFLDGIERLERDRAARHGAPDAGVRVPGDGLTQNG